MTYILGISAYYHDSAVALIKDGEIIAAVQEERFSRKKHDASFPSMDKELLLHESMARILTSVGDYPKMYNNDLVSNALESIFAGNANKDDKEVVNNLLKKGKLTISDLRARGFKDAAKIL